MDQMTTGVSPQNAQSSSHLDSLESQVERYQQVIEAMPAGVILLDTQGVVREANPEAHRILDIPLVGQKWFHLIQVVFEPKKMMVMRSLCAMVAKLDWPFQPLQPDS